MATIFKQLSDPFPPAKVSWRVGQITKKDLHKASALCYIDARDVMDRLDAVCGPGNWSDAYHETPKGRILCTISIKIGDEWVSKSDAAGDTAVEAEKGAVSDAFKRAAVKWGIGRYLYDIPMQWVQIDDYKQIVKSEYAKLNRVLPGSTIAASEQTATDTDPFSEKPTGKPKSDDFWGRPSLTFNKPSAEEWAKSFCAAAERAPSEALLIKLESDNKPHLQALPEALYNRCSDILSKRMGFWSQHPTGKAH